ncbi:MAG: signal protein [Bryobacteraceae bacterium]
MTLKNRLMIATTAMAAMLSLTAGAFAQTPAAPAKAAPATKTAVVKKDKPAAAKPAAKPAPTAAEIADAKAKGMVWVNLSSKVYHKDGKYFGATKSGQFMSEADAQKAGYKAVKPTMAKKAAPKAAAAKKS